MKTGNDLTDPALPLRCGPGVVALADASSVPMPVDAKRNNNCHDSSLQPPPSPHTHTNKQQSESTNLELVGKSRAPQHAARCVPTAGLREPTPEP
eukprot:15443798-Alexandrium_andersonii.AAC.1